MSQIDPRDSWPYWPGSIPYPVQGPEQGVLGDGDADIVPQDAGPEITAPTVLAGAAAEPLPEQRPTTSPNPGNSVGKSSLDRLSARERTALHPFRPAEELTPGQLRAFYGLTKRNLIRRAWESAELIVADPSNPLHLTTAEALVDEECERNQPTGDGQPVIDQFPSISSADRWYAAAMLRAQLPAFHDRATLGTVTPQTAGQVYHNLIEVLSHTDGFGLSAEVIVGALAARAVALGHSPDFLFLGSPRESMSEEHGDNGTTPNHDYYMYTDGTRVPIEVKIHGDTQKKPRSHYDPSTVYVRFFNDIGPALLGQSANTEGHKKPVLIQAMVTAANILMQRELRGEGPLQELDLAYQGLRDRISRHPAPPTPDSRLFSPAVQRRQRGQ